MSRSQAQGLSLLSPASAISQKQKTGQSTINQYETGRRKSHRPVRDAGTAARIGLWCFGAGFCFWLMALAGDSKLSLRDLLDLGRAGLKARRPSHGLSQRRHKLRAAKKYRWFPLCLPALSVDAAPTLVFARSCLVPRFEFRVSVSACFHDTANAVATVIYTHSLKPTYASVWSGAWNLIGV